MLSTPEPPILEADAYTQQISVEPRPGEYGVHTFGRAISTYLSELLHTTVAPPVYRENRWDQRKVPQASTFELTVDDHTVLITKFEVKYPLNRDTLPAYAIALDGQRLPFELSSYRDVDWQLARTLWIAITDQQFAAERAARDDTPSGGTR